MNAIYPQSPKSRLSFYTLMLPLMASAAALLLRGVPLLRARTLRAAASALPRRYSSALSSDDDLPSPAAEAAATSAKESGSARSDGLPPLTSPQWKNNEKERHLELPEEKEWRNKEEEMLEYVEHIRLFMREILRSDRYMDGECLSAEDEMIVREKLLCYHPRSDEKIGCGLHSIVVGRHPEYRYTRCLFVVSTDGVSTDFSYRKCLKEYIRNQYPAHAERFISKHLS